MNKIISVALISLLAGCASHGKSDQAIYIEAATAYAKTLPAGEKSISLPSVKIVSHGLIADGLAISAGGGANATQLQQSILGAKSSGETGFLIIGSRTSLDAAVIKGAFQSQNFDGMNIFFSGSPENTNEVRTAVEQSKAKFHYVSAM